MIIVRPARSVDAEYVGAHLRAADEREVKTGAGRPGTEVVPLSFQISRECYTVWLVDEANLSSMPCAIFGVCDDPKAPTRGIVWMLCTDDVRKCALSLVSESRYWLEHIAALYPGGLHTRADARNTLHIRWCKLAGFTETHSEVVNGYRFIHIQWRART